MAGATTEADKVRLALDDVLALLRDADEQLLPAVTRMAQNAFTDDDGANLQAVRLARRAICKAKSRVSSLHANGINSEGGNHVTHGG